MSAFNKTTFVSNLISQAALSASLPSDLLSRIVSSSYTIFPGFCDVHVHFREPGFSYKETIASGSKAAARGGYTAVCTMPNLNPVPDCAEALQQQLAIIEDTACIHVYPYAAITRSQQGEALSAMDEMAESAIAFSDDGRGVQREELMREAMVKAKTLDKLIVAHCEVNDLLHGGYIHDGEYAQMHGHKGICSASEYEQIKRDLALVREIGCGYHVCHISAKESVALIREAKAEGLNVTCETSPHYLVMNDSDLQEDGRFKMNPPIRAEADRQALLEGVLDGTIDMIATDHAPHSAEEKGRGLEKSAFGIVGLETALPVLYTYLVKTGVLTLEKVVDLLVINPRRRFGIPLGTDFSVWDLDQAFTVDPNEFCSKGKATPFTGETLFGRCQLTVCNGMIVYNNFADVWEEQDNG